MNPLAASYGQLVERFNARTFRVVRAQRISGRFRLVGLDGTPTAEVSTLMFDLDDHLTAVITITAPGSPVVLVDEVEREPDLVESMIIVKGESVEAVAVGLLTVDRCIDRAPQLS